MTTPEQQAREMLAALELPFMAEAFSASRLAPLANLIAENAALKAELAAIKGAGEPYCRVYEWDTEFGLIKSIRPDNFNGKRWFDRVVPLYTRPCVPLTEEHVRDFVNDVGLDWQSGWTLDECEPNRYVQLSRAVEAHIKGAKP